jgi:hypothetical protein
MFESALQTSAFIALIIGIALAFPYPDILAFIQIPPIWVARKIAPDSKLFKINYIAAVGIELYAVLAFSMWLISCARSIVSTHSHLYAQTFYISSVVIAMLPPFLRWVVAAPMKYCYQDPTDIDAWATLPFHSIGVTATLTPICVVALVLYPRLVEVGWPWIAECAPSTLSISAVFVFSALLRLLGAVAEGAHIRRIANQPR